jgi:hypothetical protein
VSQLITVREHTTPIPTVLLTQGGFRPGDQAVVEPAGDGVLIRPLTAEEAISATAAPERSTTGWLPPVSRLLPPAELAA